MRATHQVAPASRHAAPRRTTSRWAAELVTAVKEFFDLWLSNAFEYRKSDGVHMSTPTPHSWNCSEIYSEQLGNSNWRKKDRLPRTLQAARIGYWLAHEGSLRPGLDGGLHLHRVPHGAPRSQREATSLGKGLKSCMLAQNWSRKFAEEALRSPAKASSGAR